MGGTQPDLIGDGVIMRDGPGGRHVFRLGGKVAGEIYDADKAIGMMELPTVFHSV